MKKQFSTLVQAAATVEERDRNNTHGQADINNHVNNTSSDHNTTRPNINKLTNTINQLQQPRLEPATRIRNSNSISCDELQNMRTLGRRHSGVASTMKVPHSIHFDNQLTLNKNTTNSRPLQSASTSQINCIEERNDPSSQRSRTMERSMSHHMDYSSNSSGSMTRAVSQEEHINGNTIKRSNSQGSRTLVHEMSGPKNSRTISPGATSTTANSTTNASVLTTNQNPFVTIIKKMLSKESQIKYRTMDSRFPVFGWSDDGRYLMIRNPQTLFSKMMADFFVTTNLQSFVRQLKEDFSWVF